MKYLYGFVVLNYNNYLDCKECVATILEINRRDYIVVVVDNCSENDSYEQLSSEFGNIDEVVLLRTNENLGYSGGNNFGINYLIECGCNNAIIATNDTILKSINILDILDSLELKQVGIVGPKILTLDGKLQNPSVENINLIYCMNIIFPKWMDGVRSFVYKFFPVAQSLRFKQKKVMNKQSVEKCSDTQRDVYALHGSFMILTADFVKKIKKLDDHIFMFGEEDLLALECEKLGLKRIYIPEINVLHKEDRSIDSINTDKEYFIKKYSYESRKYILQKFGAFFILKILFKSIYR